MGRKHVSVSETEESVKTKQTVVEPPLYRVLIHNDDYTAMDFVVDVLMMVFKKSDAEANHIMLNVHRKGVGICGVYTHEVAETKVETVRSLAAENGYPLKCTMEKE